MVYQLIGDEGRALVYYQRFGEASVDRGLSDNIQEETELCRDAGSTASAKQLDGVSPPPAEIEKFIKMLKVGVPKEVVKSKMKLEVTRA